MTRVFNVLLWGVLLLGLTSCSQRQEPEMVSSPPPVIATPPQKRILPTLPEPILPPTPPSHKVGILLPLSGPHAPLGKGMLQAAEMALFETDSTAVTLLPQDTAKGAHQAALRALDEGAELLLGPVFASEVDSIKPLLQKHNVNLIAFSTDQKVASDRTFILGFLPTQQIEHTLHYAKEKGLKKIAALVPDSPYGHLIEDTLKTLHARGEIQLLGLTFYEKGDLLEGNPGNERLLEDITLYKKKGLDAILIPEGGENLGHLIALLKSQFPLQILGSSQWDTPAVLQNMGTDLEGSFFASPSCQERQNFEVRFQKLYGKAPPRLASLAFDATAMAINLAEKGYSLEKITFHEGFSGIDGLFRLTPQGLNERGLAILEISSSEFRTISPAPESF